MSSKNKKTITREDAFELFGNMRHSTPEEQRLYREMLKRNSLPLESGQNIFELIEKNPTTPNIDKKED